jgi:hypothetical protein
MNAPRGPLTGFGQGYICVSLLNSRNRPQSISFGTVLCHYLTRRTLGLPKEPARFAVTWPFVMGYASAPAIAPLRLLAECGERVNLGGRAEHG